MAAFDLVLILSKFYEQQRRAGQFLQRKAKLTWVILKPPHQQADDVFL